MYKKFITIGEHSIQLLSDCIHLMSMFNKNYLTMTVETEHQPDLTILIREGYGVPYVDDEVKIVRESNIITFTRADYRIEVDCEYRHAYIGVHNQLALKHALMNVYSSLIIHHNWGLLIHSSCVKEDGQAHIFAGHSGAGKSTAAKLSFPRALLSDEATIVKITSDDITIMHSPFRSELETPYTEGYVPLSRIHMLYQAPQNTHTPLKKSDAYLHLIDKVFCWTNHDQETKRILGLLHILVTRVPVYDLYFQKNNTFWELIS